MHSNLRHYAKILLAELGEMIILIEITLITV
jgi:hypothetical protein